MRQATKKSRPVNTGRQHERGVVAVEFAIILPLLALMLIGIIEGGLMARDHQILQNAAREGARFSSLGPNRMKDVPNAASIEAVIKNRVVAYLAGEGITVNAGDISVDQQYPISIGGGMTAMASEVTVNYVRPAVLPGADLFNLDVVQLNGAGVFRNFY
jgi:Flp pilus assembly protein TadG